MDLAEILRREECWDVRFGGLISRGHRELMCYAAGRLMALSGLGLEPVLEYLRDAHRCAEELLELDTHAGGSS